jgi:hypothetical protein
MPRVVLTTAVLLMVALNSPPTIPSISESRPEPPTPEEIGILEELREWIGASYGRNFEAITFSDLVTAVRARQQSFTLFRTLNRPEDRREFLSQLPYGELIGNAAVRYSLDELLLAAVVEAESGFNPAAVSPDGAIGLMQVLPSTAALFGKGDPFNPAVNVDLGARYLSRLLERFDGDLALALAAYNAGPGNVVRFSGVPPFRETRAYVGKVLSRYVSHHRQVWETSPAQEWLLF